MPDLCYLHQKPFTVVLIYDNGTEERDIRLLAGVSDWHDPQLLLHPINGLEDFVIPVAAHEDIKPVTEELRSILGNAEFYVVLPIVPLPDDDDHITARFIAFE